MCSGDENQVSFMQGNCSTYCIIIVTHDLDSFLLIKRVLIIACTQSLIIYQHADWKVCPIPS